MLLVDAFGRYSGFVKGLCILFLGIGSLLCPILMGFVTSNHVSFCEKMYRSEPLNLTIDHVGNIFFAFQTRSEWNLYLLILSIFNIWSMIFFFFFGSAQLQPWANVNGEASENRIEFVENSTKK